MNILFYELDKTLQGIKDENKQLRAEVEYLKDLIKGGSVPPTVQPAQVLVQTVSTPQDGLEERLDMKMNALGSRLDEFKEEINLNQIKVETKVDTLSSRLEGLENKQTQQEESIEKALLNLSPSDPASATATAPAPAPEPASSSCDNAVVSVDIFEQIATMKVIKSIYFLFGFHRIRFSNLSFITYTIACKNRN